MAGSLWAGKLTVVIHSVIQISMSSTSMYTKPTKAMHCAWLLGSPTPIKPSNWPHNEWINAGSVSDKVMGWFKTCNFGITTNSISALLVTINILAFSYTKESTPIIVLKILQQNSVTLRYYHWPLSALGSSARWNRQARTWAVFSPIASTLPILINSSWWEDSFLLPLRSHKISSKKTKI